MIQPGCGIRATGAKGNATLGCFVHRNGALFAVTAKHAGNVGALVSSADGTSVLGSIVEHAEGVDSALIKLNDSCVRNLTKGNFTIAGSRLSLTEVFDFATYRQRAENASSAEVRRQIMESGIGVLHSGHSSNIVGISHTDEFGSARFGSVDDATTEMKYRTTRAGDSGGPVYTPGGKLVGFISAGAGASAVSATTTWICVAQITLAKFKVNLAKWESKSQWEPKGAVPQFSGEFTNPLFEGS